MKILHINTTNSGGAFIAVNRIHEALQKSRNFQSEIMHSGNVKVYSKFSYVLCKLYYWMVKSIRKVLTPKQTPFQSFNLLPTFAYRAINRSQCDLVHLHWVGAEFISLIELMLIKKPIVVTLHDLWFISGADHYDNRKAGILNKVIKILKKRFIMKNNVTIVAPSTWMRQQILEFISGSEKEVHMIPNLLGTDLKSLGVYQKNHTMFRTVETKRIGYGAYNFLTDKRKNFDVLVDALKILEEKKISFQLILFGEDRIPDCVNKKFNVLNVGVLRGHNSLAAFYSNIDVYVQPAFLEAFGQTISESILFENIPIYFEDTGCCTAANTYSGINVVSQKNALSLAKTLETVLLLPDEEAMELKNRIKQNKDLHSDELIFEHITNLYDSVGELYGLNIKI